MIFTEPGVIAVIRLDRPLPRAAAEAIAAGGISVLELTLTTPGALESIAELRASLPDCLVGAGTVLDATQGREALAAGAQFCVSPSFDAQVNALCLQRETSYIPGAFTPTEILKAHRSGAGLIKLFPANSLGPDFVRDLRGPLPFLRLIPSGGVSHGNAAEWIKAGAAAISVGSALIDSGTLEAATLTARARALVAAVKEAR